MVCGFGAWSEFLQALHRRLPRDTGHLSLAEHGAYTLMLDVHYATAKPLPASKDALFRFLRAVTKDEQSAVTAVLTQFWAEGDGGWINARATVEIAKARVQAATNQRISDEREAKRRAHEPSNESCNEPSLLRSTKGEPIHSHSHSQMPQPYPNPNPDSDPSIAASAARGNSKNATSAPTAEIWKAYSDEYYRRYGAEPVRNRTVNGQLAQVLKRLGAEDAPHVAAFYVSHTGSWYQAKGHSVGALLADCEKIRTEWATNKQMAGRGRGAPEGPIEQMQRLRQEGKL